MGNKSFDKQKVKAQITESVARINIKRGKQVNKVKKDKQEVANKIKEGEVI